MPKGLRRSQKEWQEIVADYRQSGLSISEYGRRRDISLSSLHDAIHRQGKQGQRIKSFVEILPSSCP